MVTALTTEEFATSLTEEERSADPDSVIEARLRAAGVTDDAAISWVLAALNISEEAAFVLGFEEGEKHAILEMISAALSELDAGDVDEYEPPDDIEIESAGPAPTFG